MNIKLNLYNRSKSKVVPNRSQFLKWIAAALPKKHQNCILTITLTTPKQIRTLNKQFRKIDKATNILSFQYTNNLGEEKNYLGDLVICAMIIKQEAKELNIPINHHWAHITIHGVLHLLGYDHEMEHDAIKMEKLEQKILDTFTLSFFHKNC